MPELESYKTLHLSPAKITLFVLLVISVSALLLVWQRYQAVKKDLADLQNPQVQQSKMKEEMRILVTKVARLTPVPSGEPTVATIVDSQSLAREQVFFKEAKNGDKVLIYGDQAIIYDPQADKIVNIGPVLIIDEEATLATTSVEIRNGSQKIGAANELAEQLQAAGFAIAAISNAANLDYQDILLVNLSNKDVSDLEAELQVRAIKQLPAGEAESLQDVVVILGNKGD